MLPLLLMAWFAQIAAPFVRFVIVRKRRVEEKKRELLAGLCEAVNELESWAIPLLGKGGEWPTIPNLFAAGHRPPLQVPTRSVLHVPRSQTGVDVDCDS